MNYKSTFLKLPEHAPFSPSSPHWLNYTDEHFVEVWRNLQAKQLGTELHAWAAKAIELFRKQPRSKETINQYINDAIGFRMIPENDKTNATRLVYSENFFGTADALGYDEKTKTLRIHDLKTGKGPVHQEQLEIYAALFCLQEKLFPKNMRIILRIYQNNEFVEWEPVSERIETIMEKIIHFDKIINLERGE